MWNRRPRLGECHKHRTSARSPPWAGAASAIDITRCRLRAHGGEKCNQMHTQHVETAFRSAQHFRDIRWLTRNSVCFRRVGAKITELETAAVRIVLQPGS